MKSSETLFNEMLAECFSDDPEREGDFINADGVLCCGVCGEPKRQRTGLEHLPFRSVPCRCKREKKEQKVSGLQTVPPGIADF